MNRRRTNAWLTIPIGVALLLAACAPARRVDVTYHDPNMDFGLIQTVAVLPFENLTPEPTASERVRDVFMVMLQATGAVYVLPPGEVTRGIRRAGMEDATTPTAEEISSFARIVGADVVFTGTLREYGQARSGSTAANLVSVSVELMEAESGRVVWSASSTQGGVTAADRVFGGGGRPMDVVTSKAVDDLLSKLFR